MPKLLLVEDDKGLGYILKEYLTLHHFDVKWCLEGREAIKFIVANKVNLCLLDISLPHMDGFELAQKIKKELPHIPIIFLTARSLKVDKLKGFRFGADDYIVKPVDEEELLARINAVLFRYNLPITNQARTNLLKIGKFEFDSSKQELVFAANIQKLTKRESDLLAYLIQNKNEMVERKFLLATLWEDTDYFNRRSMDVHISKLRKYLADDPNLCIENVHNRGFILREKA